MTLTFPIFDLSILKRTVHTTTAKPAATKALVNTKGDGAQAERALMRELMFKNSEGIQSDLGLMEMMVQFGCAK